MKKDCNVLVLCTGNSCRSQMAEGYLRHFANNKANIFSAGLEKHGVNPRAIACMLEDGINISKHTSNHIEEYAHITFDFVLTVCNHAEERCPVFFSSAKRVHQNFQDPSKTIGTEKEVSAHFAKVREEIKAFCKDFIAENLDKP